MKKTELTLVSMVIAMVITIGLWMIMPNTYVMDGDYIKTSHGYLNLLHYIVFYYMIKIFLTRLGFFIHSANKNLISIGVATLIEVVLKILSFIRKGQGVTKWWVFGLVMVAVYCVIYGIDILLYDVKFEDNM